MTLLNVERIKLFSTRSPYWCIALIPLLGIGLTLGISLADRGAGANLENSAQWTGFAVSVVMVMSALSITTEYRFGTIRASFLAVPHRGRVLIAKALLLGVISFLVVGATSAVTFLLARAVHGPLSTDADFAVSTAGDWRVLWGPAVYCGLAAVLAVGVGTLVRQSAGAIAILLLWPILVENLFVLFGKFGRTVQPWLPFSAGSRLYAGSAADNRTTNIFNSVSPSWWEGGLVFAAVALVIFLLSLLVAQRRDA